MMNNDEIMANDNDISKQIEYQYPSNSHDSLLQSDQINLNQTATSSTDDLTRTNQCFSFSTFRSKDSALGLSDDNLNQDEHELKTSSLNLFQDKSKFYLNIHTYKVHLFII